jgi:hypothetical protein
VQTEREGNLDDPRYIEALPDHHPLKSRENVFAFSMACASQQMLQMLALTIAPLDQPNPGAQLYHFVGGFMEEATYGECGAECLFPSLIARGDSCGVTVTGKHPSPKAADQDGGADRLEEAADEGQGPLHVPAANLH